MVAVQEPVQLTAACAVGAVMVVMRGSPKTPTPTFRIKSRLERRGNAAGRASGSRSSFLLSNFAKANQTTRSSTGAPDNAPST